MSEDIFRIVVTAAVLIAGIAFAVQAFVAVAFYRTARKMQEKIDEVTAVVKPAIEKIGPLVDKIGPVVDKVGPIIDQSIPVIASLGPMMEKVGQVADKVGPVVEQVGAAVENAGAILATTERIMEENRPRIAAASGDVAAITHAGREQVERISVLLHDAGDRTHARLEQIDQSVDSAVEQVGQVGDAMKRAVLRPVREVNGIAAGISAAVSTLVKGRKSSVDSATQDEEMFI
jgi:ABC-type transporter Mla subunit MlaD